MPKHRSKITNTVSGQADNTAYWLALLRCPDTGSVRIENLLHHFQSVKDIFTSSAEITKLSFLTESAKQYLKTPPWHDIEQDLAWLDKPNRYLVSLTDQEYPQHLREISNPPPSLFIEGNPHCLSLPQLAVVGSRNPSRHGYDQAFVFSQDLVQSGLAITSGLALGIDGASHLGALAGAGTTIAVLGSGLGYIYPKKHLKLAEQIAQHGALVSEFPPDAKPLPHQFPKRNRIISGLSLGTLVVEAALKSGSLITAKYALEQNREVFAIPGSIHNPLAKGCHYLIKQGAKLVETSTDIWEEIDPLIISIDKINKPPAARSKNLTPSVGNSRNIPKNEQLTHAKLPEKEALIMTQLNYEASSIDTLVSRCHLTVEEISSILVELEIKGRITSTGGLYIRAHNLRNDL